ncbi:hypothetical protein HDU81_007126 [Chytriomyces hyalinus]|nr:hypothetical protein HDU81_007126 [Chytriomyces hyalinus]
MIASVITSVAKWTRPQGYAVQTYTPSIQETSRAPLDPCLFCNPVGLANTEPPVSEWPRIDMPASEVAENSQNFISVLAAIKQFIDRLNKCRESCKLCKGLEIVVFVGRSGVGKSAAINLAAGVDPMFILGEMGEVLVEFHVFAPSKVYHSNASGTLFPSVFRCKDRKRLIVDCPGFFENRSPGIEYLQRCVIKKMLESRDVKVVLFKSVTTERDAVFAELLNSNLMVPGPCLVCFSKATNDTPLDWKAGVDQNGRLAVDFKFQDKPLQSILLKRPNCFPADKPRMMTEVFMRDLNSALNDLNACPASIMSKESDALGMLVNNATAAILSLIREALKQPPTEILLSFRQVGFIPLDSYENDSLVRHSYCWKLFSQSGLYVKGISCHDIISDEVLVLIQRVIASPEYKIAIDPSTSLPEMLLKWVEIRERFWLEYVADKGQILHLLEEAKADAHGVRLGESWKVVASKLQLELELYKRTMASSDANDGTSPPHMLKQILDPKLVEQCLKLGHKVISQQIGARLGAGVGAAASLAAAGAASTETGVAAGLSTTAIVGMSAGTFVAAAGVTYLIYQGYAASVTRAERKQLNEGALIGLDYSEFTAENTVWAKVSKANTETSKNSVSSTITIKDNSSNGAMLQGMAVTIFKSHYIEEKNILFFVAISNSAANVVIRGTQPTCVRNWGTNFSVAKETFDECSFHSGYLDICQEVIEMIRADISKCKSVVHAIFENLIHERDAARRNRDVATHP